MRYQIIGNDRALVGEGPWWDADRQMLWWVDTWGKAIFRTNPATADIEKVRIGEMVGGVAGMTDGRMLLALETGLFAIDPGTAAPPVFVSRPDGLPATHRFNDLTVDPRGRLIVGSMRNSQSGPPEPTGILYGFDGAIWTELVRGLYTVNGLAFAPDGQTIYWSDSSPAVNRIWMARYDPQSGRIGDSDTFIDMRPHRGRPDGAAVDAEGGYWIAAVGGGCIHRFLPDGTLDRTIDLPVEHPTKPAFGGPDMRSMFITSLSIRPSEFRSELAGALIAFAMPVRGNPVPLFSSEYIQSLA